MEQKIINYVLENLKNINTHNTHEEMALFIRELEIFKAFLDKFASYRWDEIATVFCGSEGEENA